MLWINYVASLNAKRQHQGIYEPLAAGVEAGVAHLTSVQVWQARLEALDNSRLGRFWYWYRRHWFSWRGGLVAAGFSLSLVAVFLVAQRGAGAWLRRRRRGSSRRTADPPVLEMYRRLEAALNRLGLERLPSQTAQEFALVAGGELAERIEYRRIAHLPRRVVQAFHQVRFGGHPLDNQETEAVEHALHELELAYRASKRAAAVRCVIRRQGSRSRGTRSAYENRSRRISRFGQEYALRMVNERPTRPGAGPPARSAMAPVPEERIEKLCAIYHPKKITQASLELVDTAGLSRTHEGNATRLAQIREAGCLVLVVDAYQRGSNPLADVDAFAEDFLLADLEIVSGRVERLRESTKKPRPNRDQELAELAALEPLLAALESGTTVADAGMNEEQLKVTRSFRLLTEKPKFVLFNVADDETDAERFVTQLAGRIPPVRAAAVPVGLELELARMSPEDRDAFREEMGVAGADRDALDPHTIGRFRADALFHGRREGSPHVDAAARRNRARGGRQHPHRSGTRIHPRRDHELR